jgi:hypothetical protein
MGITITKHYCGSIFIEQTIDFIPHNCCDDGCGDCRNETKQIKVTDNFESSDAIFNFENTVSEIFDHSQFSISILTGTIEDSFTSNLFYKVKTCANMLIQIKDAFACLQVFRL